MRPHECIAASDIAAFGYHHTAHPRRFFGAATMNIFEIRKARALNRWVVISETDTEYRLTIIDPKHPHWSRRKLDVNVET